jgi:hypothetical protein
MDNGVVVLGIAPGVEITVHVLRDVCTELHRAARAALKRAAPAD